VLFWATLVGAVAGWANYGAHVAQGAGLGGWLNPALFISVATVLAAEPGVNGGELVILLVLLVAVAALFGVLYSIDRFAPERWRPQATVGFFVVGAAYCWVDYLLRVSQGEGGTWYSAVLVTLIALFWFMQWRKGRV
jgi:hypothetical protein